MSNLNSYLKMPESMASIRPFEQDLPEPERASKLWSVIAPQLKEIVGEDSFRQWFQDIITLGLSQDYLVLQCKNQFESHWIGHNYLDLINILLDFQQKNLKAYLVAP